MTINIDLRDALELELKHKKGNHTAVRYDSGKKRWVLYPVFKLEDITEKGIKIKLIAEKHSEMLSAYWIGDSYKIEKNDGVSQWATLNTWVVKDFIESYYETNQYRLIK